MLLIKRKPVSHTKATEKCSAKGRNNQGYFGSEHKTVRDHKDGMADGGSGLMEMRQIRTPFLAVFLLLPASPVTSRRRSEGIPVAGQKWLQHN